MTKIVRRRTTPTPENAPEAVAPHSDSYIRRWAQSRGLPCKAKGKIPASILEAFAKRGPEDVTAYGEQEVLVHKGKDVLSDQHRILPTGKASRKRTSCGFCSNGSPRHDLCPGIIVNGRNAPKPAWACLCCEKNPEGHKKAMDRIMIAPYAQYSGLILKEAS